MCYYFITFNRRVLLIFQNVSLCVSIKLMECLEHMKRKLNTLKCIISPVVSKNRYLITRLTVMAFLLPFVIDSKVCLFLCLLVNAISTVTIDLSVSSRGWSLRLLDEVGLGQADLVDKLSGWKITCSFVCVRPSPKHLSLDSSFVYRQMSKITKEAVVFVLVFKLCLTLCDPMDHSLPDSSVHGISQERMLEWVAIPFSRGSSWPRDRTHVSCIGRRVPLGHKGSPLVCSLYP